MNSKYLLEKLCFRNTIVSTFVFANLLIAQHCVAKESTAALTKEDSPNIILIMADDLGFECLGANGGTSYKTPHLDQLAAEGIRFEHCYSQPICTPSRVKLMTGIYNVKNYKRFGLLRKDQVTFANLLKKQGYATCVVGKWQLSGGLNGPKHFGFDEYCLWQLTRIPGRYPNPGLEVNGKLIDYKNGEYGPDLVSDYGCQFIKKNKDKPFLLYYPMILPHWPFEPTPDSKDWDPKSKGSIYKKTDNVKYFEDMVAYTDKLVGQLINTLEKTGVRENTLILFIGDNGCAKPVVSRLGNRIVKAGKWTTTDAGTRAVMIANWPKMIGKKQVSQDLIDFSDFLPTICEAAGVTVPKKLNIDGRSFLPQLKGEKGNPRKWVYCWYSRNGVVSKAKIFARNQRYKLYQNGKFYDIKNDVLEKNPLSKSSLNKKTLAGHHMLQSALDQYSPIHQRRLAKENKKKKRDQRKKQN